MSAAVIALLAERVKGRLVAEALNSFTILPSHSYTCVCDPVVFDVKRRSEPGRNNVEKLKGVTNDL